MSNFINTLKYIVWRRSETILAAKNCLPYVRFFHSPIYLLSTWASLIYNMTVIHYRTQEPQTRIGIVYSSHDNTLTVMFLAIITTEVQSTSALQRLDENNEFMATLQKIRLCFSGVPQSRVQIIASRSTSGQHMLFTGKPYITLFLFLPHRVKSVVPRHCVNTGTDNETTWSLPFLSRANQHQVDIHFWILSVNIDLLSLGIPSVACQKLIVYLCTA